MKKLLLLFVMSAMSLIVFSCASMGVAKLPANEKMFVTTATEDSFVRERNLDFPYQPLAYLSISEMYFTPFSIFNMVWTKYHYLEKLLVAKLGESAVKKLGADGIVNINWESVPGLFTFVKITGVAIKKNR